jgi:peptidoglycan/LPS O-acetylase OafA/YrhL
MERREYVSKSPFAYGSGAERDTATAAGDAVSSDTLETSNRIPELDGLRGLAILLVLACHYVADPPHGTSHGWMQRFSTILGQGATGVDLFFILSGFLIGGILLKSRSSPAYYKTFYLRRIYRIIPIYYGWLLIFGCLALIAGSLGGAAGQEFRTAIPYWVYFVFIQNYLLATTAVQAAWLGPLWSLAVEEQFYLVSPILIRNLPKPRLTRFLIAAVLFALILRFVLATWFGPNHGDWGIVASYFWTPARADELALGMLVAIAWTTPYVRGWLKKNIDRIYVLLCISVGSILLLMYWLVKPLSYAAATLGRPVYGLLYSALLVICLADCQGKIAGVFRWRWLREMGRVSYCVYIIHYAMDWLVFRVIRHSSPRFDSFSAIGLTFVAFALTFALAKFSWHFIEHPLIRRGHRFKY